MAEFTANALNSVGSLRGQCIILLTGAAITVKTPDGDEIASWPYNCIRQFGAEEDLMQFTFKSGRRGPFGVADYAFELSEQMLRSLQDALTKFTGAQFCNASQPVLPGPSYSSAATLTYGRRTPGRSSSTDSVFSGPLLPLSGTLPPRLPPRQTSLSSSIFGSPKRAPLKLAGSISEGKIVPAAHRVQPLSSVLPNQSYEATGQHQRRLLALSQHNQGTQKPSVPPKRKTSGLPSFDRTAPLPIPEHVPESTNGMEEHNDSISPHENESPSQQSPNKRASWNTGQKTRALPELPTEPNFSTLPARVRHHQYVDIEFKDDKHGTGSQQGLIPTADTLYDHLPSSQEETQSDPDQVALDRKTVVSGSPVSESNLDYVPRDSPKVCGRPLSPDHIQHLSKFTTVPVTPPVQSGKSPDALPLDQHDFPAPGVEANHANEESGVYDVPPSAITSTSQQLYQVPRPHSDQAGAESLYNVPRPSGEANEGEIYHIPRPQPGQFRKANATDQTHSNTHQTYDVPKAMLQSGIHDGSNTSHSPPSDVYDIPRNRPRIVASKSSLPQAVYQSPKAVTDSTYQSPKAVADSTYQSPKAIADSTYQSPKAVADSTYQRPTRLQPYETVDVDQSPKAGHRLKTSRSLESLFTKRINNKGHISPDPPSPHLYIEIDRVKEKAAQEENVYAEIPEDLRTVTRYTSSPIGNYRDDQQLLGLYATIPGESQSYVPQPQNYFGRDITAVARDLPRSVSPPRDIPRAVGRKSFHSSSDAEASSTTSAGDIQSSSLPGDSGELDEYVIVTRAPPRDLSTTEAIDHEDEYQVMRPAHIDRTTIRRTIQDPPPLKQNLSSVEGSAFDGRSGSTNTVALAQLDNQAETSEPIPQRKLVKVASGSPRDTATILKFGGRSVGDILDVEKHTYVNVAKDLESTGRLQITADNQKKPVPLPRNSNHTCNDDSKEN